MKIVFFGTPPFAANVLSYLIENHIEVAAVVTRPDKPKGRSGHPLPTPVKSASLEKAPSTPILQPEKVSSPEFFPVLQALDADLFVVVAFGEIMKQQVLDIPSKGCINLHASLLPKYRGAAPIQHSIIQGENETGVTVMYMVKKMDAGDMIKKAKISIGPNDTFGEVEKLLCEKGAQLLLEVIGDFKTNRVPSTKQIEEEATYAPKIELEDCEINWNHSAQQIHNLVRGVNPYPGAWCQVEVKGLKKKLKIHSTQVEPEMEGSPGQILRTSQNGLVVSCGSDALRITELQLEGKKAMTPDELLRGTPLTIIPN